MDFADMNNSLFDLSQPTSFSQLPDDDFLALLQKQFPATSIQQNQRSFPGYGDAINPQNLSHLSFPAGLSPPEADSSPSPPSNSDGRPSMEDSPEEYHEPALKRKASDEDMDEGPSQKNQHTEASSSLSKKGGSARRRSSGTGTDETKQLKRKEQNRAAQRAFRERKEKHVKDLEDKVAALEAKNDVTSTENENLRELLSRLQSENMTLRQHAQTSSFTFTVPKAATVVPPQPQTQPPSAKSPHFMTGDTSMFSTLPRFTYTDAHNYSNPLDMTSMLSFNPSVLNLLDETPQQTATDGAMQLDIGFGNNNHGDWLQLPSTSNLTTLSTNSAYLSLASMFDATPSPPSTSTTPKATTSSPSQSTNINDQSSFNFDFNSLTQWPTSSSEGTLDDLFGGYTFAPPQPMDVDALLRGSPVATSASMSPVVHHQNMNMSAMRSPSTSSSSSPGSNASSSPAVFSTRESSSSESEAGSDEMLNNDPLCGSECPKSKEEARQRIMAEGASSFVHQTNNIASPECQEHVKEAGPSPFVGMNEMSEAQILKSVACQRGSGFPSTERNEANVEVLAAWRCITTDPQFKEADITKLCSEFASKARCDGSKVVLEPAGVSSIKESLARGLP